tara:strand:+ start:1356 stop:3026 length:1671 start_codon:yes stop_codon:yes gene_type:complete
MKQIIECVPNISEGRNQSIINNIVSSSNNIENAKIVDVDSGYDTNRTVITIVGKPEAVLKCAYNIINKSLELINLNKHTGTHARMGATDVCPIIPIENISMDECIELSKKLAKDVAEKLNLPVYLYEKSALSKERINLANIRKGEFELMHAKIKEKKWKPDYGKASIHPTGGVIAIGARNFLVAYNINLNTMDKKIASDIALDIREAGRAKRDENGKIIRDKNGKMVKVPGTLKETKAVGWFLDEHKISQVSMNLVNIEVTSIHMAFEEVREQARKRGVRVTGSEIVGLVPKDAIIKAGNFYLNKQKRTKGIPEDDIIKVAIMSLGLNDISNFDMEEKIIERLIYKNKDLLSNMKINHFIDLLSSNSPAPGGGSVAALVGSISSALNSMVASLTVHNKKYISVSDQMEELGIKSQLLKDKLKKLIDEDTDSFDKIMDAFRLPKKTKEEISFREQKIQQATIGATEVPYKTSLIIIDVIEISISVMKFGNKNSFSDGAVAAELGIASVKSAIMNVKINLNDIKDKKYINLMNEKISSLNEKLQSLTTKISALINQSL